MSPVSFLSETYRLFVYVHVTVQVMVYQLVVRYRMLEGDAIENPLSPCSEDEPLWVSKSADSTEHCILFFPNRHA